MRLWLFKKKTQKILDPDEIFLDAKNLPSFDNQQFEGQIERPISKHSLYIAVLIFAVLGLLFTGRIGFLQIIRGEVLAARSDQNKLRHQIIFPDRGVIYDRHGKELVWNNPDRVYTEKPGFAHVLGYVGFPTAAEIKIGDYHPKSLIGKEGAERIYNNLLGGQNGIKIEEIDALGAINSDHVLQEAESGKSLTLTIDSRIQAAFYQIIASVAEEHDYAGGAGVVIDVKTGDIISLVSFPEYDPTVIAAGQDRERIDGYLTNPGNPFLNRAVTGLYAPGSVIKPFMAMAALNENIISPEKEIVSTGQLVVPNPYNPDQPTIFKDWRAHGATDMRRAIAVSSDTYFYQIGGGFGSQPGLGISLIEKYMKRFGFGSATGIDLPGEAAGIVPNPAWKAANFDGEDWLLGNTYHTAIGQYGFLVTPLQMARATAALASGRLLTPRIINSEKTAAAGAPLDFAPADWQVVREGMRQAVTDGTAAALNVPYVKVAAKTGTAEVGPTKSYINAWIVGFFPYDNPRYAFTVVMERGRQGTLTGGGVVFRRLLDFINQNTPEYLIAPEL